MHIQDFTLENAMQNLYEKLPILAVWWPCGHILALMTVTFGMQMPNFVRIAVGIHLLGPDLYQKFQIDNVWCHISKPLQSSLSFIIIIIIVKFVHVFVSYVNLCSFMCLCTGVKK